MSFRRPYWLLMFISLACLVLGFTDWMIVTPDFKGEPDSRTWIFLASYFLAEIGIVGLISSLVWMFVSGPRPTQAKRLEANIRISVAEAIQVEVLGAINRAGGLITNIRKESEHSTGIDATVPRQNLASFEIWLRGFSNGQGRISEDETRV